MDRTELTRLMTPAPVPFEVGGRDWNLLPFSTRTRAAFVDWVRASRRRPAGHPARLMRKLVAISACDLAGRLVLTDSGAASLRPEVVEAIAARVGELSRTRPMEPAAVVDPPAGVRALPGLVPVEVDGVALWLRRLTSADRRACARWLRDRTRAERTTAGGMREMVWWFSRSVVGPDGGRLFGDGEEVWDLDGAAVEAVGRRAMLISGIGITEV